MATAPSTASDHAGPSALRTLIHFLRGGLLGGVLGLAFAVLQFYVLVTGFLYAGQAVHGSTQDTIVVPHVPDLALMPPISAVDLDAPEGRQEGLIDTDYLGVCWQRVWQAVEIEKTWWTLAVWAGAAGTFGLAIGLVGALLHFVLGHYWSPALGILALAAAVAAIAVFVLRDQYQFEVPIELDAQGRALIYAAVAALNLWWTSIAGFRFRAVLFILATVVVGEIIPLGLPPEKWTMTALWHVSVFLFVPTGYLWLAVERGERKNII